MQNLVGRGVLGLLGVAVTLAWWSFSGDGSSVKTVAGITTTVWAGTGGKLEIEVETTSAARFSVGFNERSDDGRSMETWEKVAPGMHRWTVNVPQEVGGYIELGAESPKVGDKLSWKILVNGKVVDEQSETLEHELSSGYAFFLQSYFEDYSTGEFGDD